MFATGYFKRDCHAVGEPVVEVLHRTTEIIPMSSISDSLRERSSTSLETPVSVGLVEHHLIIR